jgi:aquaporin Z
MCSPAQIQKYLVEFFGTLFFLYVILSVQHPIAIGAALTLSIFIGGKISGGNFNPAVTIMMTMAKKMKMVDAFPYIIAQILGGVVALQLYKMM